MKKFLKNQKGVTMIEVLVTIAILAIVVTPCLSSFVMAQRGNVKAKETTEAYTAAANLMEELKGGRLVLDNTQDRLFLIEDEKTIATAFYTEQGSGANQYFVVTFYAGEYNADQYASIADVPDDTTPVLEGVIAP